MSEKPHGRYFVFWLGLVAFVWAMLFVWQGLDFTDMGFWLTGYQQIYSQPETIWGACWLSSFIGYWCGQLLGSGVLAYRLGSVAITTVSAVIVYRLLSFQFGNSRVLAAMVLLTVGYTKGCGANFIVDYYELTALFYLAGAALLYCGLIQNRKWLLILAGVVLGANVFIRLPNVLGMSCVVAVWFYAWFRRWAWREVCVVSANFLGGFAAGVALILALISLHGHLPLYLQALRDLFGEAANPQSTHAGSGLLKLFVLDHIRAFALALPLMVLGAWAAKWGSKQKKWLAIAVVLAVATLIFFCCFVLHQRQWCVPGICYVVLLAILFGEADRNAALALLAFLAGMVLVLTPLGSDCGVLAASGGMWLPLPVAFIWLWQHPGWKVHLRLVQEGSFFEKTGQFEMSARGFRFFTVILALALLMQALAGTCWPTGRDSPHRFARTHPIAHPLLVGIYTTAARAKVVSELLTAMPRYVKPGDSLLACNGIPLVYFLTQTKPWLGSSWLEIGGGERIANRIRQKEAANANVPCIVRAKGNTDTVSWPSDAQALPDWGRQDEARRVVADFEQRHGYVVAWSNDFFEILTAETCRQATDTSVR